MYTYVEIFDKDKQKNYHTLFLFQINRNNKLKTFYT